MEVDAVKARGSGKKRKDARKDKVKAMGNAKAHLVTEAKTKDKISKDKDETSGDDRACYSCGRHGHCKFDKKRKGSLKVKRIRSIHLG